MAYDLVGLKQEAEDFIKNNINEQRKDEGVSTTYGEDYDLYEYSLKDGTKMTESVQKISNNNEVFLLLIAEDGRRLYEWTDEEISNA
jgi:hypothetical protein